MLQITKREETIYLLLLNTERIVRFELLYIRRQNHTRYIFKARGDRIFVLNTRRIIRFKSLHREKHNIFLDKLDHPAKEVISMLAPPSGEGDN